MTKKISPVMQQYLDIKKEHPHKFVFFRIGDFYELFYEDAQKASELLDITLTARGKDQDKIPMAGVPYHSAETYLKKIIESGESAVICEQVPQEASSKQPMKREISQILTPGTVIDEHYLDKKLHNYIASYFSKGSMAALAWSDLCKGQVFWQVDKKSAIEHRLNLLNLKEIVISEQQQLPDSCSEHLIVEKRPHWEFSLEENLSLVLQAFKVQSPSALPQEQPLGLSAITALVHYCSVNTQAPNLIKSIKKYRPKDELIVDQQSRQHLELNRTDKNSLYDTINQTVTAMGSRLMQTCFFTPTRNRVVLKKRHEYIEFWRNHSNLLEVFRKEMKSLGDMERYGALILKKTLTPRDLGHLMNSLDLICSNEQTLWNFIEQPKLDLQQARQLVLNIQPKLQTELPLTLREGTIFTSKACEELAYWKDLQSSQEKLLEQYEKDLQDKYLFPLKAKYNKVHGFYIEVTKTHSSKVPDIFVRKQTLTNCERYITQELKELEEKSHRALEEVLLREQELYEKLLEELQEVLPYLDLLSKNIAQLDVTASLAFVSEKYQLTQPRFTDTREFSIKGGRHLMVELLQKETSFIENDLSFDQEKSFLLITGPNMGGKSTYMRQQALIVFLASIGSYVPAQEAILPDIDRIFTRIGAHDNIAQGQSTFMVEMIEASSIIHQATSNSLVIMDEIGRGTSTFDGMALAKAIARHLLAENKSYTLFATHYHDLVRLEEDFNEMNLVHMGYFIQQEKLYFTYQLKIGPCYQSFGLHVAQLAGLPQDLLQQAREYQQSYQKAHEMSLE